MRQKIVAGNWKMNTVLQDGLELAKEVEELIKGKKSDVLLIVAPPFTHLAKVNEVISDVKLAAQNCASESGGAYTGEVSPDMLIASGVEYVILGHSERRSFFHEENDILNKKVKLVLSKSLSPIYCCGEILAEREQGEHLEVIKEQITVGLDGITGQEMKRVIIAYEPVWAIGTGVTASPEQAQEIHKYIRDLLTEMYDKKIADETTILYGGSCKPSNAKELFSNHDVDGGLIGGAALNAADFVQIANSF